MTLRHSGLRTVLLSLVCAALVVSAQAIGIPAANAVMPTPTGLAPNGSTEGTIPVLSWDRVTGATSYGVQVSMSPTYSPVLWSVNSTENRQAVPTVGIPAGTVYWRVQAKGAETSDWATASFTRSTVDGPTLLSPANGEGLDQPDEPPLLSWSPVSGVSGYTIEISQNSNFTDQVTSYTTKTTNMVVPNPQIATTYYWRVKGTIGSGLFTAWSAVRSYAVNDLPPAVRVAPATDGTVVDDAVLDWEPIDGANTYQVQISTDSNFNTIVHSVTGVTGTKYARPQTLNNDQYYWRVRAVGVTGVAQAWETRPVWGFQRAWPDQPQPVYPANGATVGDPFYFQWTPATLASGYTIELSTTAGFSPADTVRTCFTENTTYTPGYDNHACMPVANGTYYWRVIGHDGFSNDPPETVRVVATVRSFTYNPTRVTLTSPANGEALGSAIPTLHWEPLAGSARYRVTVTPTNDTPGGTITATTAATSFTPRSALEGTYRWDVQTVSEDGRLGSPLLPAGQRTFTVGEAAEGTATHPDALSPLAGSFDRFPTLSWKAVAGATKYRLYVRTQGTSGGFFTVGDFAYAAGEDWTADYLSPDTYEWFVEAYDGSDVMTAGDLGSFTIAPPPQVTGQRVALTGTAMDAGGAQTCDATLPAECQNLRQTPLLRWDPEPNTGYYLLYISRDRELTNIIDTFSVTSTRWIWRESFADSQAGTAYYWYVRPCRSNGVCKPLELANHAFNKLSNAVDSTGPGVVVGDPLAPAIPVVQDDVTLTWADYLLTNTTATQGNSTLPTKATTEANRYRVQVSTVPNFQTLLDNITVDQRQFTSFGNTYPEGNVYWRVQAIDESDNALTWSPTRVFFKQSPVPTLLTPTGGASEPGYTAFTWHALKYAASYDLEVYKDGDTQANAANRVFADDSAQTAYSRTTPLPVSANPYVWRVRRLDAKDRPGGWSAWGSFMVTAEAPTLTSPAAGATVAPRESLFSWSPVTGAAEYRFERRVVGTFSSVESVNTVATSYAPSKITDGSWEWRVSTLDTNNVLLASSGWRPFSTALKPVATEPPTIEGSGAVDTQLTGFDPVWNLTGVTNTYQWIRGTSPIAGANSLTYVVTTADLGKVITLRVTGSKPGYDNATTDSNGITATAGAAPTTASPPSIAGSGQVTSQLTATPPTWNQTDVTETRQWLRDGAPISGQTGLTYTVVPADVGKQITWRVTGKKTGFADAVVVSNGIVGVVGPAPVASVPPSITGTGQVGSQLTGTSPTWNQSGVTETRQWLRDGVPISGQAGLTYTVSTSDVGKQITWRVTGEKSGLADAVVFSNGITGVAAPSLVELVPPSITGTGQVGSQLTGTPGTWNQTGVTETRQWLRDGVAISGQSGLTYTVVTADVGKSISWRVTGKKTGLADAIVVSNGITAVPGPAPVATVAPSITGTPTVGSTLKVAPGTWSNSPSLTYQWHRNGVPIAGATSTSYKVLPSDSTQQIGAVVTATKAGLNTGSAATANVTIAKMTSTTTASLAATQIKPGKAAKLKVTVTVTGEPLPTGKIVVRDGTKVVKTVTLSASREGVITIKIKKLKRGKHKLKASYAGTATIVGSKAKKQVLRVAR